jgi:hypothetical protein
MGMDRIHRIQRRGNWMHNSQPLRCQGVSCASACPVDRLLVVLTGVWMLAYLLLP